ncbi:MAG: T9SS type A sorting domain-containing protein [Candidatus Latescibacteria bacterium]|nr:T9SS type A sorting domain-containing protein [Candidatus Latescibacterota bacterium]
MVWANGFLYILNLTSNQFFKYDIKTETTVETHNIHENPYGITWDGEYLWIGDPLGNIYAYNLDGTSAGYSFSTPFSSWSGIAWDNQYFIVAPAFVDFPTFYRLDETGSIIESFESEINLQRFIVYVPRHTEGHILSNNEDIVMQLKLEGGSVSVIQEFYIPSDDYATAIAHDGTDLWCSDWNGPIYQIDDGIVEEEWLQYSIESGSVVATDWHVVEVTFGSENLAAGVYHVAIIVNSNDPTTPQVKIPVILNIELPYIASITSVNNLTVVYNTIESEALSQLSETTTIKDQFNNKYTVNLNWTIVGYDGSTAGQYHATGIFDLPDGVIQSDPETDLKVTAIVTVLEDGVDLPHIVSIEDVDNIEVAFGTVEADALAKLSSTTTISDSHNNSFMVNLSWSIQGYNGSTAADYNATGVFNLPNGVVQSNPETNLEVTAIVKVLPVFQLTLAAEPAGSGTLTGDGDYGEGDIIKVTAYANAGWNFISWGDSNGILSNNIAFNYTMPAKNVTLTAKFSAIDYEITININPHDAGSYSIEPNKEYYHIGDVVTLVASPSAGYEFVNWTSSQGVVSVNETYTFTMPAKDVILTANFDWVGFVNNQEILDIKIFPNPARNEFNVVSNEMIKSIKVININGLVVKNASVNDQIAILNVQNINTGVYFVQIYTESGTTTKRLLIIR